ncbi:SCUBE1 [Branchiostoma lanceolatum]|uniref:SCUBE1 protein n=1 Tax=Branchiostoma lanceolatum TaxID=7740 RepID=A0A8K0EPW7_BRALA|nr:SCUBE1 [Branchiostoma lanceolatum]
MRLLKTTQLLYCLAIFMLMIHASLCLSSNDKQADVNGIQSPFWTKKEANNFLERSSRKKRTLYEECYGEGCVYEEVREVTWNTERSKEYLSTMACDAWGCTAGYLCVRADAGTSGSGPHWRTCNDVNECLTSNGGCEHTCSNNEGSYTCSCNTGYSLSGQHSCTDVNECTSGSNGGCDHLCANTAGSYRCSCNTGYYLSGQHSCAACDSIADCEVLECTGPDDSTCSRCQYDRGGDALGYLLAADGTSCTQLCSWQPDSLFCYPGNCGSNNLPSSCTCAPDFNGTNCLSIQVPPEMTYCAGMLMGDAGDVSEAPCTDVTTAPSTVWTNLQEEATTMQLEVNWEAAFEEPSPSDWPEPYYVDDRKIGMTEASTDWWLEREAGGILNGSLTCQSYEDGSTSHVVSQDSPALSTHNCTRSHVISATPQHRDRLYFTAKSRNGGYVKIRNYDGSSGYTVDPPVYYSGQEVSRTAHFTFDFVPPYHCFVQGNCTDNMLDRGPAITRNGTIRMRWSGWQDDDSGIRAYTYEIARLQPCGDGLGMPGQECQQQESALRPNQTDGLCALSLNGTGNGTNSANNITGQNMTNEGNIMWGNCTAAEGNGTEPALNGTQGENATASTPQENKRRIREAAVVNGNGTSNITVQGENANGTTGSNRTVTSGGDNSTASVNSSVDGRNVTNGGNVTDVDEDVVNPLNGSVGSDTEQVDVTITEPGVYSVTLIVEDSTGPGVGNVITARRFLLFDDSSTVETDTSGSFPLLVTSAANDTGWLWQTNLHDDNNNDTKFQLTWSGHFFNELHRDNNFLGAIVAHPNNISAEYEETSGQPPITRSREAIRHVQGIVLFQTTWGVDHQGGRSLTHPSGDWDNVTDVMVEGQDFEILREDGDTVRFWVRAIDVMGDVAEDDVTIHIDSSPPALGNVTFSVNWTDKIDFLKVHAQAHDLHSGLLDVYWRLQDTITPLLIHGEGRMMFQTAEECEASQCYCIPKDSDCFLWEYTIDIDVREMNLSVNFLADEVYYVTLTVTNNAMLRTTDERQVIVDKLPGDDDVMWLLMAGGLSVFGVLVLLIVVCLLVAKRGIKRKVVPTTAPSKQKYQSAPTPQLQPNKNFCNPSQVILPFKEPTDRMTTTL